MNRLAVFRLITAVVLAVCLSNASLAQKLFDYDFSDPDGEIDAGYAYGFAYAGYGPNDCSGNIAATTTGANAEVTSSVTSTGSAQGIADYSNWTNAGVGGPAEPSSQGGSACWNYAGLGVGVGNLLAYTDEDTNELIYTKQFTTNDLSQYSITFDAWVDGMVANAQADMTMNLQFQIPDGSGTFVQELTLGTTADLIEVGYSTARTLSSTRQTFTIALDTLQELSSPDHPTIMTMNGNAVPEQGGTGAGSYSAWKDGDWKTTAQFQFQVQAAGADVATFGLDANNIVHIDNFSLTAPFMSLVTEAACDFDGNGECNFSDLEMLYDNWGVGSNDFDLDGNGTVESADIVTWLAGASDPDNPFNASGVTYTRGDVDLDGDVDSADLGQLLNSFGNGAGLDYADGNLNDDVSVNSADLGLMLNTFGFTSSAPSAVPEPGSESLLLLALAMLPTFLRRRR